jgi:hypothetical protein
VPDAPNQGNSYQLRIPLPKSTPDFDRKLHLLGGLNLKRESSSATFVIALRLPPAHIRKSPLWVLAKALVAKSVDELAIENGSNASVDSDLDAKAGKFLKDRFELLLKSYAGMSDKLMSEATEVQRSIQLLKMGEVEILKAYIGELSS